MTADSNFCIVKYFLRLRDTVVAKMIHVSDGFRENCAFVTFFLKFMTRSVDCKRHSHCAATSRFEELASRADAQTTDLETTFDDRLAV